MHIRNVHDEAYVSGGFAHDPRKFFHWSVMQLLSVNYSDRSRTTRSLVAAWSIEWVSFRRH